MIQVDVFVFNPFEAVRTTVLGTQPVIETAIDSGVWWVQYSSSDQAVDPANTMGTTTLLAETLMIDRPPSV